MLELPGITVEVEGAEVRVHPPVPLDDWPRDLARLQVKGTELEDVESPGPAADGVVLWLNPAITMSAGKAMAQVGHAAQLAWWASGAAGREAWRAAGLRCAVRTATPSGWEKLLAGGGPVVRDAGFTEIEPGSCTVAAEAPWITEGDEGHAAPSGPLRRT